MEDVVLGREVEAASYTIVLGAAALTDIVPINQNRVTLTIHSVLTDLRVAPSGVTPTANVGLVVTAANPPFERSILQLHGDVKHAWQGFSTAGGTIVVIETFLQRQK